MIQDQWFIDKVEADIIEKEVNDNKVTIKYKNPVNEQVNEETFIRGDFPIKNIIGYRYYQTVEEGIDKLDTVTIKTDDKGESEGIIYPHGLLFKCLFTFGNKTADLAGISQYDDEEILNNKKLMIKSFIKLTTVQMIFVIPITFILTRIFSEIYEVNPDMILLILISFLIYMISVMKGAEVRILLNRIYSTFV